MGNSTDIFVTTVPSVDRYNAMARWETSWANEWKLEGDLCVLLAHPPGATGNNSPRCYFGNMLFRFRITVCVCAFFKNFKHEIF